MDAVAWLDWDGVVDLGADQEAPLPEATYRADSQFVWMWAELRSPGGSLLIPMKICLEPTVSAEMAAARLMPPEVTPAWS